jgi:Uma2 family endonuclease
MRTATAVGPYTFDDFCALVKDGDKADLIDGVIYMASPENTDANLLFVWLIGIVDLFVEAIDAGRVFGSRVALRLDMINGPEPDIAFIRKRRLSLVKRGHIAGPADLVMEIVSPESIERDYEKKRRQYEQARIPEYWIVDELTEMVTLLRLGPGGKYREVKPRKGELQSRVLPGFWIRPEWLWQSPRPKKTAVLAQLLARLS